MKYIPIHHGGFSRTCIFPIVIWLFSRKPFYLVFICIVIDTERFFRITMPKYPVVLNVYDMYWINSYTFNIGLGVFHSGVVIHGREYAYGGHPYEWSGIFDMLPKCSDHLGPDFKFRESIKLGVTEINEEELNDIIREMGSRYTGLSYHLVDKNCNHFTSELTQVLCGKDIPGWVNRLANAGSYFPFLLKCLPKEWIRPEPESPTSPLFINGAAFRELSGSEDKNKTRGDHKKS